MRKQTILAFIVASALIPAAADKRTCLVLADGFSDSSLMGQQIGVVTSPQSWKVNGPASNAVAPTIRIVGRTRYADESGLHIGKHWYFMLDPAKSAVNLQNGARIITSDIYQGFRPGNECDNLDFLHLAPNSSAEIKFNAPETRTYRLRFHCLPYGNSAPVLDVALDGKVVGQAGGVLEDVPITAGAHILSLKEAGHDAIVPSSRLVALDLIEITTDRQENFIPHYVCKHPSDPRRLFWQPRRGIPLSNPSISDGQHAFTLNRTFADGELVIIHPDGTVSAGFATPRPAVAEDELGLQAGKHFYLRIDPCQIGKLKNAKREWSARARWNITGCHKDRFILLDQAGTVTVPLNLAAAGQYLIAIRIRQIGNSAPAGRLLLDGKEIGTFTGTDNYRWYTVMADLNIGHHELMIQECGTANGPNTNMINLDMIEVTSDTNISLPNKLADGELARLAIPLVATADISANKVPRLSGETFLNFSDAPFSSHQAAIAIDSLLWQPLDKDVAVLQPNGDGVADEVQLTATLKAKGSCTMAVYDAFGRAVRNLIKEQPADMGRIRAVWDGKDDAAKLLKYGSYEIRLLVQHRDGQIERWATVVGLDPDAPPSFTHEITVFSPNNDGVLDTIALAYKIIQPAAINIFGCDSKGRKIRNLFSGERNPGAYEVVWDGRDDEGLVVPKGGYQFNLITSNGKLLGKSLVEVDASYEWPKLGPQMQDFFPIGVFGFPGNMDLRQTLRRLKQDGFNMIHSVNSRAALDIVGEEGMKAVVELPRTRDMFLDERKATEMAASGVRPFKDSGGLLGYYLDDEPGDHEFLARNLTLLTLAIAKEDPGHPSLVCLIGQGSLDFHTKREPRGVLYIDVYPVSAGNAVGDFHSRLYDGWDMGRYVDFAQNRVGPETPVWVIVQCHRFSDQLREPTPEEIRCQTYLNLAHGAKGIIYFTLNSVAWPGLWVNGQPTPRYEECARLAKVIQELAPTLLKLRVTENIASVVGGGNPAYSQGEITTLKHQETGRLYVWVVNRNCLSPDRLAVTAALPPRIRIFDVLTGKAISAKLDNGRRQWACDLAPGAGRLFAMDQ